MEKNRSLVLLVGTTLVLAIIIFLYWWNTRGINSPEEFDLVFEEVKLETSAVPPSANPIESVSPEVNPVEKTNPFKYENPFE